MDRSRSRTWRSRLHHCHALSSHVWINCLVEISSAVYRTICFLPVYAIFASRYYVSAGKKYFMPVSAICAAETGFCRQKANPVTVQVCPIYRVILKIFLEFKHRKPNYSRLLWWGFLEALLVEGGSAPPPPPPRRRPGLPPPPKKRRTVVHLCTFINISILLYWNYLIDLVHGIDVGYLWP